MMSIMVWKHSLSPLKSYHSFKYPILKKMCLLSPDIHWFHHSSSSVDLHFVCCSICRIYTFCLASLIYLLLDFLSSYVSTFEFWVLQFGFKNFFTHFPCLPFSKYLSLPALGSEYTVVASFIFHSYKWLCLSACLKTTHSRNTHTQNKAIIKKCQRKYVSQGTELYLKSRYQ